MVILPTGNSKQSHSPVCLKAGFSSCTEACLHPEVSTYRAPTKPTLEWWLHSLELPLCVVKIDYA